MMRRDGMRVNVGLAVLEKRNSWVNVAEISFETGATFRQVSAVMRQIPDIDLNIEEVEWGRRMYLAADEEEATRIWVYIMHWRYKTDDILSLIRECIPYAGWISNRDLTVETGVTLADLETAAQKMKDVEYRHEGKMTFFRKTGEDGVLEHNGVAKSSDGIIGRKGRTGMDGCLQQMHLIV
ncbi:MAG: hypothetical protein ACI38Y_03145 [Candidatus Methanomethylophilaceae archaeon]